MTTKPLLIVKTGQTLAPLRAKGEDFEDWIVREGRMASEHVVVADVVNGASLPGLAEVAGIVVTGSPAMVTDRAPWSEASAAYLREACRQDIPILGICYGHQLLAHALGGHVDDNPQGREIGTAQIRLTPQAAADPLFAGLPEHFDAHTTHSQTVLSLPPGSVRLASSARDGNQGYRAGGRAWGVQFHPEFDALIMRTYIATRSPALEQEGFDVAALTQAVADTPVASSLLQRFVQIVFGASAL